MKTRILLLVGMCLGLAACESMDLVPKSQGNYGAQNETYIED